MFTNEFASNAILRAVETKSLVQSSWHSRAEDGRQVACLLGSISPDVRSVKDCNASLMPLWLAELTPTLFDGIPADHVYPVAERYGRAVGQWNKLTDIQWNSILVKFLVRTIDDALSAARPQCVDKPYWQAVEDACASSKAAIVSGDDPEKKAEAAARAAEAAARAAARAAWAAARTAAEAAAEAAARAAYLKLFTFLLDTIEEELAI